MLTPQFVLALAAKLVIDLFAGGGGASTGIEQAIGRPVDVAINHDEDAIGMHEANHPQTRHFRADIREVDPLAVTRGQAVGLLHASPDCTHHSQALGGQPRKQEIRSLAWQVLRWAGKVRPDVITLENVEQMLVWSPLIAKRDPGTGRVLTLDRVRDPKTGKLVHRVADPGERVPRGNQFLVPDPSRKGHNWEHFVGALRSLGYVVQWRVIVNAQFGAHSTRKRLYLVARCDGLPITWPEQTHAKKPTGKLKAYRPAAECIDWSIPGRSIFDREKPLAEATMRRAAYGLRRFVLDSTDPFIVPACLVPVTHSRDTAYSTQEPLRTITTANGGETALAVATLIQMGHGEGAAGSERWSYGVNDIRGPVGTITASGAGQGLTTAYLVQANGGFNATPARDVRAPLSTATTSGSQQQLITAELRHGLTQQEEAGALRCAAFLMRYHGTGGQWADLRDPITTITTHDRLALVTVWLKGEPWVIVDICLRMLVPRELYNAQDFPPGYIIDRTADGKRLSAKAQVRMCGNSVSPLPMRLIVAANYSDFHESRRAA